MALPLPNLDDRRWSDLVEEGRALIPLYSPEWSDHNFHDPGITLIELFAWIAEMDVYQVNRISDRHRRKFLQLIAMSPAPPRAASTLVAFALRDHVPYLRLPATLECEGRDPFGERTRFRILEQITVVAAALEAVQRVDAEGVDDLTAQWRRGEELSLYGADPKPGAAVYLGFSEPLPVGESTTVYFLTRPLGDLAETPPASANGQHHSVRTTWEFLSDQGRWMALNASRSEIDDRTRCFTENGLVRVTPSIRMAARRLGGIPKPLYYLRCRFVSGAFDRPPTALAIAMNAVPAEQSVPVGDVVLTAPDAPAIETERISDGSGRPNQQVTTSQMPIDESTFRLFTVKAGEWREWMVRSDFDSSGRADDHCVVDAMTGIVRFGDGNRGRVAPEGAAIVASYRTTRADKGNLGRNAIDRLSPSGHNMRLVTDLSVVAGRLRRVTNPVAATGGLAAESVFEAQGRVLDELERPRRAITLDDYEYLAMRTPRVRLARVAARAMLHPSFPCVKAPGMITVIVIPYLPVGRPVPGCELLRMVAAHLDAVRAVGTRVNVVGPVYVTITVQATVESCLGVSPAALQARIADSLNRFLDPLAGGPDGVGWPFGRDVYRSEILQIIDGTPGVDHVLSLEFFVDEDDTPRCGNVCIGALGLVTVGRLRIEVVQP